MIQHNSFNNSFIVYFACTIIKQNEKFIKSFLLNICCQLSFVVICNWTNANKGAHHLKHRLTVNWQGCHAATMHDGKLRMRQLLMA